MAVDGCHTTWRPTFAFPENGPAGLEESCYTLVYQGVRIVGMNSSRRYEDQAKWLDGVLAANNCRWVVCTFHHPIYSTGKDRDNAELRGLWKPILDKYHVDLVLQGHDHTYGRTGLETPLVTATGKPLDVKNATTGLNKRDRKTGTVYVVSVSGPKMYTVQKHPFMKRQAENTQLYQIIHIDGDKLRYEARTAIGDVYDAFTLTKREGQINELTEQIPNTPERRKPADVVAKEAESKVAAFIKVNDQNKDSKLTREEIPTQWRDKFEEVDTNKDGTVTATELKAALK